MENGKHLDLLRSIDLGSSVAEDEQSDLLKYFVETEIWDRLVAGGIDVVYGPKGAGKSALYILFMTASPVLDGSRKVYIIPAEKVTETPVFSKLTENATLTEEQYKRIWKLYILTILVSKLGGDSVIAQSTTFRSIEKTLKHEHLLPFNGLENAIKRVSDFVTGMRPSLAVKDPQTGLEYKLAAGIPTVTEEEDGFVTPDNLLKKVDLLLNQHKIQTWVAFDRLDVAFDDQAEIPALRALFRAYLDLKGFTSIFMKIFLRDDIWDRITKSQGFREQSHITKSVTIVWNHDDLQLLILRRFLNNPNFKNFVEESLRTDVSITDRSGRKLVWELIFPEQIRPGDKQSDTFNWIISHLSDGKGRLAPRDVIQLIQYAKEEQIKLLKSDSLEYETIFGSRSLLNALNSVSKSKRTMLLSEYPTMREQIVAFEGEKTEYSESAITAMFSRKDLIADKSTIDNLVDIGLLQKRRSKKGVVTYWVPFIFRSAFEMSQGASL